MKLSLQQNQSQIQYANFHTFIQHSWSIESVAVLITNTQMVFRFFPFALESFFYFFQIALHSLANDIFN